MNEYSTHVRRKDRQKPDESFLREMLSKTMSCTIAVEKEGYPFLHVAFFVYDECANEIVFHFSKHGYAGEQIRDGSKATVSINRFGKLYTAKKAVDFGCEYQSIIAYGNISIVSDENERMRAMQMFFHRFFGTYTREYEPFTPTQTKPVHVAKFRIADWAGKEHLAPEFATDSFYFPERPVI